jgi:hypothetical protein
VSIFAGAASAKLSFAAPFVIECRTNPKTKTQMLIFDNFKKQKFFDG